MQAKAIQAIGTYKTEPMVVLQVYKDRLLIMINNDPNSIDWYRYNHTDFVFNTWFVSDKVS